MRRREGRSIQAERECGRWRASARAPCDAMMIMSGLVVAAVLGWVASVADAALHRAAEATPGLEAGLSEGHEGVRWARPAARRCIQTWPDGLRGVGRAACVVGGSSKVPLEGLLLRMPCSRWFGSGPELDGHRGRGFAMREGLGRAQPARLPDSALRSTSRQAHEVLAPWRGSGRLKALCSEFGTISSELGA